MSLPRTRRRPRNRDPLLFVALSHRPDRALDHRPLVIGEEVGDRIAGWVGEGELVHATAVASRLRSPIATFTPSNCALMRHARSVTAECSATAARAAVGV